MGAVAAVLYVNSLGGEFVFDDHEAIENNPDVRYVVLKPHPSCLKLDLWVDYYNLWYR